MSCKAARELADICGNGNGVVSLKSVASVFGHKWELLQEVVVQLNLELEEKFMDGKLENEIFPFTALIASSIAKSSDPALCWSITSYFPVTV